MNLREGRNGAETDLVIRCGLRALEMIGSTIPRLGCQPGKAKDRYVSIPGSVRMRAAVLEAAGELTVRDVEPPSLDGPDQVLIRVFAAGICGSEIHAFKGTHPFRKPPAILGHEIAGVIVEMGRSVHGFALGDSVFLDPQWTCGECKWCRTGRHNLCPSKRVIGIPGWSGGLAEYVVAPARGLHPLPCSLSYVEGTLIEPLSVAVHAVHRAGVVAGESVAILGTGPIGMMVAVAVSARGASPVITVDLQQHCLDVEQGRLGATHGLLADQGAISDTILAINDGEGIDVVFLTVGAPALVREALSIVAPGERIGFLALFDEPFPFEPFDIVGRDVTIIGSQMYNADEIRTAIDLISSGKVPAGAMVTHVLPLDEAQRGFDLAATKADGAIKVVLELPGS